MKILYTAKVTTTGGRDGSSESADGNLKLPLSMPKELGGPGKPGTTNPEQLFAAGYSACFASAIQHVARLQKIAIPALKVEAEVSLTPAATGFALLVSLHPEFTGLEQATAEALVKKAHEVCPYSNAVKGNINVALRVNGQPLS